MDRVFTPIEEKYLKNKDYFDRIKTMKVRDDDIWILSFKRSGTTWAQEMTWLLANNLDFERASIELLTKRFLFPEIDVLLGAKLSKFYRGVSEDKIEDSLEEIEEMPSPRFIKTHLPFSFLPPQLLDPQNRPKLIFVVRNPKDVCVSTYYHYKLGRKNFEMNINSFVDNFIRESQYWNQVSDYYSMKNEKNVFLMTYESMKKDLKSVAMSLAKFLNKTYCEDDFNRLTAHLSFESMKKNSSVNHESAYSSICNAQNMEKSSSFIRKGQVESWREELSAESVKKLDDWILNSKICGIDEK